MDLNKIKEEFLNAHIKEGSKKHFEIDSINFHRGLVNLTFCKNDFFNSIGETEDNENVD